MIVYAESSAVLAWLLGEAAGDSVRAALAGAAVVFASLLTAAEAHRALARLETAGAIPGPDAVVLREILDRAASHWIRHEVGESVLTRAGRRFPVEPVRTLDAIHLATALELHTADPRLHVLSLDHRIRANATSLGLGVLP